MKNRKYLAALSIVAVLSLSVGGSVSQSVLAAPPNNPPTANVDASFNSASFPDTSSPNVIIDAVAGIYSLVQATVSELTVAGESNLGSVQISADGEISNDSSLPLTIVDPQGIEAISSAATGGSFEGTQIGVRGNGNVGGQFTGETQGILSNSSNGSGGVFTGKLYGLTSSAMDALSGTGVVGTGTIGVKGTSTVANIGMGVIGTGTKNGGQFTNSVAPSNNVDLATTSASVSALGAIKNQALTIATNGDITNATVNSGATIYPVKVVDAEGLYVSNGTNTVEINPDGRVGGLTNLIGNIKFSNNLLIDSIGTLSNVGTGAGGVYGLNIADWPVTIDDNLKVGTLVNVTKSTGNISTSGDLSVKNVTATGPISSTQTITASNGLVGKCTITSLSDNYCNDFAEQYKSSERTEAGDILEIDEKNANTLQKSRSARSGKILGVVSTSAGIILGLDGQAQMAGDTSKFITDSTTVMGLAGVLPTKVNTENGPIKIGDLITSSSVAGVGMKADEGDATVGIALESYDGQGAGKVNVLISRNNGASELVKSLKKQMEDLQSKNAALEARMNRVEELLKNFMK